MKLLYYAVMVGAGHSTFVKTPGTSTTTREP